MAVLARPQPLPSLNTHRTLAASTPWLNSRASPLRRLRLVPNNELGPSLPVSGTKRYFTVQFLTLERGARCHEVGTELGRRPLGGEEGEEMGAGGWGRVEAGMPSSRSTLKAELHTEEPHTRPVGSQGLL